MSAAVTGDGADLCVQLTDKNLTGYKPFNIAVHEEVADHYGIPSIDCAAKVYTMIHR